MFVAALAGFAVWSAAPAVARLLRERPAWCLALVAFFIVAAELANRFVLFRLYPAFHLALAVLVLLAAPLAAEAIDRRVNADARGARSFGPTALTLGVFLLCPLLIVPSARRLAHFDNFRFMISDSAPLASHAVKNRGNSGRAGTARGYVQLRRFVVLERSHHAACGEQSARSKLGAYAGP